MLVLTRHRQERIWIKTNSGELIEVLVIDVWGGKVRLGLSGPAEFMRDELVDERWKDEPIKRPA